MKSSGEFTPRWRVKAAKIYRAAAKALELGEGSPYVTDQIGAACGHFVNGHAPDYHRTIVRFKKLEAPYCEQFEDDGWLVGDDGILSLCFMAAIVERP